MHISPRHGRSMPESCDRARPPPTRPGQSSHLRRPAPRRLILPRGPLSAPLRQRLKRSDERLAVRGETVADLNRHAGHHSTIDEPLSLEFLQALRQQSVGDALDRTPVLAEPPGTQGCGQQDRPGPAAPHEFQYTLKTGARVVAYSTRLATLKLGVLLHRHPHLLLVSTLLCCCWSVRPGEPWTHDRLRTKPHLRAEWRSRRQVPTTNPLPWSPRHIDCLGMSPRHAPPLRAGALREVVLERPTGRG